MKLLPTWFAPQCTESSKGSFYACVTGLLTFGVSQIVLVLLHGRTCPSMASSMVLSGLLFTLLSLAVLASHILSRQPQTKRHVFLVYAVVVGGYSLCVLAPSSAIATAVLCCYYLAGHLCEVGGRPNPGLMMAIEPLVVALACALGVCTFLTYCVRQELVERGHVQPTCCVCCNRCDGMYSTNGTNGTNTASIWTRLTTASNTPPPSLSNVQKKRRTLCCRLFFYAVLLSIVAWLIVSGWLGLLPGQWTCLPLKPSGCTPFVPPPIPAPRTTVATGGAVATPPLAYKLSLWHEGYPIQTSGSDEAVFVQYVQSLVAFCIDWKFSRCFLQLYNPTSTTTKPHTVFAAASVATHFVQPLIDANIEAGFVVYARPKDTGWSRAAPLKDIATYVQLVDAALTKTTGTTGTTGTTANSHVCCLAFDHEDLGTLAKEISDLVLSLKNTGVMWKGMQVGYAGGVSLLSMPPDTEPGITDLYPELYWYGELAPGHETQGFFTCSTDCVTAMPCFSASCVTTPYRKYVNQPTELLNTVILPNLKQQGLSGGKGMDASSLSRTKRTIWSMFSFEHLAGCCAERAYGPGNSCGTFDGLALWTKDKVLALFQAYAMQAGYNSTVPMPIAVYEFQFIPPHLRDPALSSAPVLKGSVSSAVPLMCDGT